jgi:hypothetical protein
MTIARVLSLAFLLAIAARAEEYWIAYEGNDFPENEGWTRTFTDANGQVGQGGAVRTLNEGTLSLDSRESLWIVDFYQRFRAVDPAPGELFRMEWRAFFDHVGPTVDPGVSVFSDQFSAVGFEFTETSIRSVFEQGNTATFVPGLFHEFTLLSTNMQQYELSIDGSLAMVGNFVAVSNASRVGWGDVIQGGVSVSEWDYMRFGVVPEPAAAVAYVSGLVLLGGARGRATV